MKLFEISFSRWFYQIDDFVHLLISCMREKMVYGQAGLKAITPVYFTSGKHRKMPLDLSVLQIKVFKLLSLMMSKWGQHHFSYRSLLYKKINIV